MVYMTMSNGTTNYSTNLEINSNLEVFYRYAALNSEDLLTVIYNPTICLRAGSEAFNHAPPPTPCHR